MTCRKTLRRNRPSSPKPLDAEPLALALTASYHLRRLWQKIFKFNSFDLDFFPLATVGTVLHAPRQPWTIKLADEKKPVGLLEADQVPVNHKVAPFHLSL